MGYVKEGEFHPCEWEPIQGMGVGEKDSARVALWLLTLLSGILLALVGNLKEGLLL